MEHDYLSLSREREEIADRRKAAGGQIWRGKPFWQRKQQNPNERAPPAIPYVKEELIIAYDTILLWREICSPAPFTHSDSESEEEFVYR